MTVSRPSQRKELRQQTTRTPWTLGTEAGCRVLPSAQEGSPRSVSSHESGAEDDLATRTEQRAPPARDNGHHPYTALRPSQAFGAVTEPRPVCPRPMLEGLAVPP